MAYNKGQSTRKGEACSYNILGLLAIGESGIAEAKTDGGLNRVFYWDTKFMNIIGLFGSVCTRVYGI